jgi:4-alpha-glucanotransferase
MGLSIPAHGNSPYHSISAFASNPLLISPDVMVQDGLLEEREVKPLPGCPKGQVDYEAVTAHKEKLFNLAYKRFKRTENKYEYERFCTENFHWLEDFARFAAFKAHFDGKVWREWTQGVRDRQPEDLESISEELRNTIERERFLQYVVSKQWRSLKEYCNGKGIQVIGDMPIYVTYDSADVWTHPELFKLDEEKRPHSVAGVPPDYFSETGQRWGNPLYRWDVLREKGYDWWIQRMKRNLMLYDLVRVDHFRGFVAYWEVPATEKTAENGMWVAAPAKDFFNHLTKKFSSLPIIAEDLGIITPDVREVMRHFGLPGMKVLLFAFGEDLPTNPYIPHNIVENCILYTGTHDNNTVRGWFEEEANPGEKRRLFHYLGREVPAGELHWELIRLALMTVARITIIPMQDILGLGGESRMNRPATAEGNWQWRFLPEQVTESLVERLGKMTEIYGRT